MYMLCRRLAVAATCKAWRAASIASLVVNESITVTGLHKEQSIFQFAAWLLPRAKHVCKLQYSHMDSVRNNPAGKYVMSSVANFLTSLELMCDKSMWKRRGIPGPSNFNWLPLMKALESLTLIMGWSPDDSGVQLDRWAPYIQHCTLVVKSDTRALIFPSDFGRMPRELVSLALRGNMYLDEAALSQQPSARNIRHLDVNFQETARVYLDGSLVVHEFVKVSDDALCDALQHMTALTSLALDISKHVCSYTGIEFPGIKSLRALAHLPNLRELRLVNDDYNEDCIEIEAVSASVSEEIFAAWMALEQLEVLHLIGSVPSWHEAALKGATPRLKTLMLARFRSDSPLYLPPPGQYVQSLERLAIDCTGSILYGDASMALQQSLDPRKATQLTRLAFLRPFMHSDITDEEENNDSNQSRRQWIRDVVRYSPALRSIHMHEFSDEEIPVMAFISCVARSRNMKVGYNAEPPPSQDIENVDITNSTYSKILTEEHLKAVSGETFQSWYAADAMWSEALDDLPPS
jgi:hypothetical protein